ncbi:DNA-binding FadR family transcriptional regulator [Clostridium saccharoperbutylacetonicum]|uniref:Transcriptional regulator n=1 Tax=Clostridium saccharoperbutylacetonicum N1-4(HMT) TaxID=931276 RepID=M1N3T0_9CLOT|nr:FadR/GntR family transcriptional regulator [Clostridium saccharoperbutylacetonicum]AGF58117.1 transcriptional regulator [Clostridium saccharoperbutylacetonicum N1-4(HMT)]NRT61109.1 DNA-binding FadR family transcriptional regulator [Clostridium saccharoperbutylacetonicum]NSB24424.1 DNA-binding FadR family transcriptional regulator [Clostridium saccharoperbutylacetonicum]NSB43800.1 DNA-binding FadR family transcriptional regulator [Clostridium saccharoperbutylacetonicum]
MSATNKFNNINNSSKSLGEQMSDRIIQLIIENNWSIGDKLPNEYELADMLNVGRSTVREAIKALVSRNILEIRRGAGTFVSQKCGIVDDPLGLTFVKDKFKLALDLLEVRFMIEPGIAAIAAVEATEEEIQQMTILCNEIEALILKEEPYTEKDIEFHTAIAKSSKNLVMENLIPIINSSIAIFIDITSQELRKETIETHREVLNAITEHDSNGARDAMFLHLVYNRRNIKGVIKKRMND